MGRQGTNRTAVSIHVYQALWIFVLTATPTASVDVNVTVQDTREFKLIKLTRAGMIPLESNNLHIASSLTHCAALCRARSQECFSFVYNSSSHHCQLGSWSVPNGRTFDHDCENIPHPRNLAGSEGSLFSSACCTGSYILRTKGNTQSKCVRYVPHGERFDQAQEECMRDGGQLITFKTIAEYEFVRWLLRCKTNTWVGMRDSCLVTGANCKANKLSQRKLVWVDKEEVKGQVLTEVSRCKDLDNFGGDEHCIHVGGKYDDNFNDEQCDEKFYFACEKNPLKIGFYCK
ncbi:lectin C-type domain containing protein [Elysia marginata]|uniref:Lectin C-type domain containing protein n=1 Tax=Elysia marginata TaxID=1093978 RepID=A0AAV4IHQ7_9GAST|nr:lectin C-type domain containing protein [Elysia marginata]